MRKMIIAAFFVVAGISTCLSEVIEITLASTDLQKKEPPVIQKMFAAGEKIAMQVASADNNVSVIFRGDKQLMWTVNHEKKEYMEMTKETMDQLGQTMNAAFAQMKAQMANMPPEQRAMMEKMMKGQMGSMQGEPGGTPAITYKKTGESKTINGYSCVKFEVFQGSGKISEMWVTDWKNLKDLQSASSAFESMGTFFKGMMEAFKDNPYYKPVDNPYSSASELKGFPVLTISIRNGVPEHETALKSIEKKSMSEEVFNVPAGYKAASLMKAQHSKKK